MIAVIIQARMGSSRLPGKVLKELNGIPMLQYQYNRVSQSKVVDKVIIATTVSKQDDEIASFCEYADIPYFRGSEHDVLDRYYQCALQYRADVIIRITSDCPLIDPVVIDDIYQLYKSNDLDYAVNTVPPETSFWPDGSDVEIFSLAALKRVFDEAVSDQDREHVTFYFWRQDNGFKTAQLTHDKDWSKYRYTVDYPEDYEVVIRLVTELGNRNEFGHVDEIAAILEDNPEIAMLNSKYYFGIGWNK